jgi:beta-phosphoglucomutase
MQKRGVIFDMDGVLVDSYRPHLASWQRLARENGLDMTQDQFAVTFGKASREIIKQLWSDSVTDAEIPQWDAKKEAYYREELQEHFPEMDGVSELIRDLKKAGYEIAIGSSGPAENVAVVRECLSVGTLFSATVNGHEVKHGKPAPDVFLAAAEKLRIPPQHCVVVEDAPVGVEAGKRAGMAVIAITGTAIREKLSAADKIIDSMREISARDFDALLGR